LTGTENGTENGNGFATERRLLFAVVVAVAGQASNVKRQASAV
jgi:hypothetical protein